MNTTQRIITSGTAAVIAGILSLGASLDVDAAHRPAPDIHRRPAPAVVHRPAPDVNRRPKPSAVTMPYPAADNIPDCDVRATVLNPSRVTASPR